ncbi:ATP synthase mitochondrial F1 complex assembly factor 1 [Mobula hypostoma]|uniref:ATP synthase mitochondrial F1 complex assembly factor 1 n=1 Tax=Mobula hypostoma TaxID=723540 RepID=UPI002FC30EA9
MCAELDKMVAARGLWCFCSRALAVRNRCHLPLGLGVVSNHLRTFSLASSLSRVEKEQDLQANPFYSKYQNKIQELRRTKPDEYEARIAKKEEVKRLPLGRSSQGEFVKLMEAKPKQLGERTSGKRPGFTKHKTLQSILNLDMVKDKTPDEIAQIWNMYFASKNTISAVIPGTTFELMYSRSQRCPTFLYALPRQSGYEFFVGQWSTTELHFSSLINLQSLGENSPSQLIIYHYPDLQKEKGIVLLTAEIDTTFLSVQDAQCLANEAQLFYATDCQRTFNLVETFNHEPNDFKHMSVIAEIEQHGIGGQLMKEENKQT